MNSNAYLFCVRCKKNARFICERCSDSYCSKNCQVIHWPFHRTMCFPMPSLLEMPPNEQNMISSEDTRNSENLVVPYHSNSQNQHRFGPKNNNSRKNYNFQRSFRSESYTKPAQQEVCDSGDIKTVDSKNHKSVQETQRGPLTVYQKSNKPIPLLKETEPPTDSRKSDEIINLAIIKRTDIQLSERKTQQLMPKISLNWDEETTDPVNDLVQLMSNEPRNWQKPFPLENGTFVTITHLIESPSPTVNCWVVQNQYTTKRKYLQDEMKRLHGNNVAVEIIKIITNEIYCVQYEDSYYRGVCLYQINSKEVLVRLIDVGLIFQARISAIKCLDPRLKTINAFAFEINFETSQTVSVGQTLNIYSFSVDATGTINVKLEQGQKNNQMELVPLVPLPIGVPMELFCLDYSKINEGYISACRHDPKKIESINQLSNKIEKYLKISGEAGKYFPKLDEICFVYHDREHQWYRAECIKEISSDSFEVLFIDFGSTRIVNSTNTRKFVSEFTEPAIMHFCCINGIPRPPTNELATKMVVFFNQNPIFSISNAKYDDGLISIDCPELLKAILT